MRYGARWYDVTIKHDGGERNTVKLCESRAADAVRTATRMGKRAGWKVESVFWTSVRETANA